MTDLRIVFMGTPEFAVKSLEAILEAGYNVAGVVTAPDRPAGRGRKLKESAVKTFAVSRNLKVLQPTNLKSEEFQQELQEINPNVQVVVAFRMLPKSVWNYPELGTFNLHASLLPQYRGAAPINWAIMNGEKETGISTFFLDEKIDTGAMIMQESILIGEHENLETIHDRLMNKGSGLVVKTLEAISKGTTMPIAQEDSGSLKEAPKLNRENTKIDWEKPLHEIYNHIRGLNPYPAAWCYLDNADAEEQTVKIYDAISHSRDHDHASGKVLVEDKQLMIAAKGGFIEIKQMQLPGKRKMETRSLLNGFKFSANAKLR
ncbi:methionyl-tRNA formyltransferase [Christiangramia portivictoriae]|uniref:methionyl-tRNA formyltransferase n=1 Tax=Christiangramia portivictoriae TaxID=326069 RepID=UPI000478AA9C|nr:methionyl-tRNA formyltransferase [Christiangramia portivictoriae]